MADPGKRKIALQELQHQDDPLQGLRLVRRALEARSITAAARSAGTSVSTVSRAVQQAERYLGVALFVRSTRGVVTTEAGRQYREHLARWLGEEEALRGQLGEVRAARGALRVTVPVFVAEQVLPPVIAAMREEHPEISLDVHASDDLRDLVKEGFDLALRLGPLPDSTLEARRLISFRRVVCAAPSLLSRVGTPAHPSALEHLPVLHYGSGPGAAWWKFVHSSGEVCKIHLGRCFRSNNIALLCALAERGVGVIRLPDWSVAEALRSGRLTRMLAAWSADTPGKLPTLHAVHPRDAGKAALRGVFLQTLERLTLQRPV
ncbi:MAG: LysR family transcriptional regulator [Polyangiaceae bacterium]|jgi:DNA-binding transcriptional LysR family regulator|nr:LysR family transcriptional regulator [Polyangiaceae bacterium]